MDSPDCMVNEIGYNSAAGYSVEWAMQLRAKYVFSVRMKTTRLSYSLRERIREHAT